MTFDREVYQSCPEDQSMFVNYDGMWKRDEDVNKEKQKQETSLPT